MSLVIVTDSCCDLPLEYVKENDIEVIPLSVKLEDKDIKDDLGISISYKEFYNSIREGKMPKTAQINAYTYEEAFKRLLKDYDNIIYIAFSSALSGGINSARLAKEEIDEAYGEDKVTIIDSLSASMGLGMLVYCAKELQKKGHSHIEISNWIEENKLKVNHWFTVDDLHHLERGGRVSKIAATFGTVLNIKPILHVNNEGKLLPVSKVKGRKKSIKELAKKTKLNIVNKEVVFISHGDCLEEAEYLKKQLLEDTTIGKVLINNIGAAVGSHSGPGTLAIFFIGEKR